MLTEPLLKLLQKLKLTGMLAALERQLADPDSGALRFEERLALLLQHELAERDNYRFSQRLRIAALPQPACLEDLDTRIPTRHLDPALISTVRDLGWIVRHLNVLITGPTGIGKSFIGAALAHAACRANYPDAILDRVVHNAYHLDLNGESIRKLKAIRARNAKNGGTQGTGSIEIAAPGAL